MAESRLDRTIRELSGRGHAYGLSTPFTHSALAVIAAGGTMPPKDTHYLIKAGLVKQFEAKGPLHLSDDGELLLCSHKMRGDRLYIWAQDMIAKTQSIPRLVAA